MHRDAIDSSPPTEAPRRGASGDYCARALSRELAQLRRVRVLILVLTSVVLVGVGVAVLLDSVLPRPAVRVGVDLTEFDVSPDLAPNLAQTVTKARASVWRQSRAGHARGVLAVTSPSTSSPRSPGTVTALR